MENIFTQHLCQEYQDNGDEHDWNGGNFFHQISLFGKNTLHSVFILSGSISYTFSIILREIGYKFHYNLIGILLN